MNPIEKIKKEKNGLELLNEFPRLAAMHANDLSDDDKQRIKWLGFWHRKDGTLMTRIRIPGGVASSAQLRVIAGIAQDFGHDLVDITTRAQIQLRYLSMQHIPIVFERLASVGLSSLQTGMDSIRNVVTSSVTGICHNEVVDALPVVNQVSEWITNGLAGNAATADLPRKMNIHITGHKHDMGASTNDIGLYPASKDGRLGFNVMVGGAVGGKVPRLASELDVFVMSEQVLEVIKGIVEIFDANGPREERHKSRLKWLLNEWGEEKFRSELEAHLNTPLETAGEDLRVAKPHLALGVQRQKQVGMVYIGAHVPVGRTTGTALLELADLAQTYGTGEARFTIEQNIVLPNVSLEEIVGALEHPFFAKHTPYPSHLTEGVVSCTGIEFCSFALIETKSRALEIAAQLEAEHLHELPLAQPLRMHWSGCQHACSSHHIGDFGFQGTKVKQDGVMVDAVDIFVGGQIGRNSRLGTKIADRIPLSDVAAKIAELAREHLPGHFKPGFLEKRARVQELQAADD